MNEQFNSILYLSQKKRTSQTPDDMAATNARSPSTFVVGLQESPLIDFVLRRHPQETLVDRLKREYIRTSQDMTISNLKVFLGKKLSYEPHSHFQVRIQTFMKFGKAFTSHVLIRLNNLNFAACLT